jgi:hypothetical protein
VAAFFISLMSSFPVMLLMYFLSDYEMITVAPVAVVVTLLPPITGSWIKALMAFFLAEIQRCLFKVNGNCVSGDRSQPLLQATYPDFCDSLFCCEFHFWCG